jgi:hypothetical protein
MRLPHDVGFFLAAVLCCGLWVLSTMRTGHPEGGVDDMLHRHLIRMRMMYVNKSIWGRKPVDLNITWNDQNDSSAVFVCIIASKHLGRTVRVVNSMIMPPNVSVHLLAVSSSPVVIRPDEWKHGRSMVFRNLSAAWVGRREACFIVIEDTADPGPYLVYWFWRMCSLQTGEMISGDEKGTALAPTYNLWKKFIRKEKIYGNHNVTKRLVEFYRNSGNVSALLYPPVVDDSVLLRAEYQPLTEREHLPRLARVWSEDFVDAKKTF